MPYWQSSTTSISGNWDTPVYVDIPVRELDPYSFPTTTNVRIEVDDRIADWVRWRQEEAMRQLGRVSQSHPYRRISPPPKKFFGQEVTDENRYSLAILGEVIEDVMVWLVNTEINVSIRSVNNIEPDSMLLWILQDQSDIRLNAFKKICRV